MKKYSAYCKNHDWEGKLRDLESEAYLDLESHIELFPLEDHDNSGVLAEKTTEKGLQTD